MTAKPQPGRSSPQNGLPQAEVEKVLKPGGEQVVLIGNSRGGYTRYRYIQNGGGDKTVSHAVLSGTPNHGVQAVKGYNQAANSLVRVHFAGAQRAPKNAAGDEVVGVKWLTIRSDSNDKFAQPDGLWIGLKGKPTTSPVPAPNSRGATCSDPSHRHRETAPLARRLRAAYRFLTGHPPRTTAIAAQDARWPERSTAWAFHRSIPSRQFRQQPSPRWPSLRFLPRAATGERQAQKRIAKPSVPMT